MYIMFSKVKIIYIERTTSTQDAVIDYLKNDYYPSLLLIAKIQSSGRGSKSDDWISAEGGFWATLGTSLSFSLNEKQIAFFHYFTAILLARVIQEEYDLKVQIKWPNDILYENKKLAGILIDYVVASQNNYFLIGMGVNLNNSSRDMPKELQKITISIKDLLERSISIENFAHYICFYANQYYMPIIDWDLKKIQILIQEYNLQSRSYRKEVILDDSKKYICNGINSDGLMEFAEGKTKLLLKISDSTRIRKIYEL